MNTDKGGWRRMYWMPFSSSAFICVHLRLHPPLT